MTAQTPAGAGLPDALRGPWTAVLTDGYDYVYERLEDAQAGDLVNVTVVRGTAVPVAGRLPEGYSWDDVLLYHETLDAPEDAQQIADRWTQAQAIARALNALAEPESVVRLLLDLSQACGERDALAKQVEELRGQLAESRVTAGPAPKDGAWLSHVGIDLHRVLPTGGDGLRIGCTTPVLGAGTVGTYELMRRRVPGARPCTLPGCWPGAS